MIPIIIMIISLILDGILTNYLPYLVNDLSLFTPLLTLTIIFIIYPFYRKNKKKYLIVVFILGIIYDLFYTNLLFFNGVLFLIIAIISMTIYKNLEVSYLRLLILGILKILFLLFSLTLIFLLLFYSYYFS